MERDGAQEPTGAETSVPPPLGMEAFADQLREELIEAAVRNLRALDCERGGRAVRRRRARH